jgi:hypothetical protein
MHFSAFQEALCASFQDGLPSFQDCHAIISSEASVSQLFNERVKNYDQQYNSRLINGFFCCIVFLNTIMQM